MSKCLSKYSSTYELYLYEYPISLAFLGKTSRHTPTAFRRIIVLTLCTTKYRRYSSHSFGSRLQIGSASPFADQHHFRPHFDIWELQ
jgi:hypothetical protein